MQWLEVFKQSEKLILSGGQDTTHIIIVIQINNWYILNSIVVIIYWGKSGKSQLLSNKYNVI